MIDTYNHFMGGVDGNEQMIYCYLDESRTLKYWKKDTFNMFARMVLNAYIIYSEKVKKSSLGTILHFQLLRPCRRSGTLKRVFKITVMVVVLMDQATTFKLVSKLYQGKKNGTAVCVAH